MPQIKIYQIDAFANQLFEGNPAAVCPLAEWLPDETMQKIAAENNLAETAFYVPEGEDFHIRWFTPAVEVDLCGHATLATAYVLFELEGYAQKQVSFQSRSGELVVVKQESGLLQLDFPKDYPEYAKTSRKLFEALGIDGAEVLKGKDDYLLVLQSEEDVAALRPNMFLLAEVEARGIIVTAPSQKYDFVSRFFGPRVGINEDPVTGSAFTLLTPFWANRLEKDKLTAKQISPRGGEVFCELAGDRVKISGRAVKYLEGMIAIG